MPRKRPFPPRPDRRFRIGCVQWNIENVAKHVRAGFATMSEMTIRAHYFRYLEFLERQEFTHRPLVSNLDDVNSDTTLWSDDLTPLGYRFVQFTHDRWIGRILKFSDTPKERAYLDKWLKMFLELPDSTFAGAGLPDLRSVRH